MEVSDPTTIYWDNLRSIQLARNPVFHALTKHIQVHYHFVYECVLSGEFELIYVSTDRETVDIFTKPLGLDKLRQFPSALGLQHVDVLNLRGRRREEEVRSESDEEFDFGTVDEVEDEYGGSNRRKEPKPKPTEKGRDRFRKTKTKTWLDVFKGQKIKEELETANSNKIVN